MDKDTEGDVVKTDISNPNEMTVKELIQMAVGQMFRTNNPVQYLSGQLDNGSGVSPEIELELRLVSIDGVSPE